MALKIQTKGNYPELLKEIKTHISNAQYEALKALTQLYLFYKL